MRWYALLSGGAILAVVSAVGVAVAIQDRTDRRLPADIERAQSELLGLGAQITAIKDADERSANDYIAAYAESEPLQKEYDEKLQKFSDLYSYARERDSHRGILDLQRFRSKRHPEAWDRMSEIIGLVRPINDINKREGSVVHAMASLPDKHRMRFFHEEFMPLAAQDHVLRQKLAIVGQDQPPRSSAQYAFTYSNIFVLFHNPTLLRFCIDPFWL